MSLSLCSKQNNSVKKAICFYCRNFIVIKMVWQDSHFFVKLSDHYKYLQQHVTVLSSVHYDNCRTYEFDFVGLTIKKSHSFLFFLLQFNFVLSLLMIRTRVLWKQNVCLKVYLVLNFVYLRYLIQFVLVSISKGVATANASLNH